MRTQIGEHKGQKIWIDQNGQFWTGEKDTKRSWNIGTSLRNIKEEIDFLDAYEAAPPVKVLRIEFPYLQVWNIRMVTHKRYGNLRTEWYTKDNPTFGADHGKYPREFIVTRDVVEYDEGVYLECERRFKEIREHYDRFDQFKAAMPMPRGTP